MVNKKAAIELSIGTIVIIVLAMTMLILGLVLVRSIFTSATDSVKQIDDKVKGEINKLFVEDDIRKIVIYPSTRLIKLKQGSSGEGFAFSIRNLDTIEAKFTYDVVVNDATIQTKCRINPATAKSWIDVGASGTMTLASGNVNPDPIFVRYTIPETASTCTIRFSVVVKKDGEAYTQSDIDLKILPS